MNTIKITDNNYPEILKQIYNPPRTIYATGNIKLLNEYKNIAIIGCRKNTEYGRKAAMYFSYNLAKKGFTIISGLAEGIDSFAHIGALEANGKTIAVIGSGINKIYPKQNIGLARAIVAKDGLVITEHPLGTKAKPEYFPARNRIISGLSQGVLVIEAKEKSGTLITVDHALEQGREVFAVPGNPIYQNSKGTNNLIKEGAKIVMKYEDVIQEIHD